MSLTYTTYTDFLHQFLKTSSFILENSPKFDVKLASLAFWKSGPQMSGDYNHHNNINHDPVSNYVTWHHKWDVRLLVQLGIIGSPRGQSLA